MKGEAEVGVHGSFLVMVTASYVAYTDYIHDIDGMILCSWRGVSAALQFHLAELVGYLLVFWFFYSSARFFGPVCTHQAAHLGTYSNGMQFVPSGG